MPLLEERLLVAAELCGLRGRLVRVQTLQLEVHNLLINEIRFNNENRALIEPIIGNKELSK